MMLREVEQPRMGNVDVLIRVAYSGICGSELSGYLGQNSLRKPPLIFGHEFSGTIVELGDHVSADLGLKIGQRVTANPLITCGRCNHCLSGNQQRCVNRKLISAALPGSNAEYVTVPARFVLPLPESVSMEQGAMVEPVACAVRIAELVQPGPDDRVLVLGMGPIGLLALQALKVHGVSQVIAVDRNRDRLAMAERCGALTIAPDEDNLVTEIDRLTNGAGLDAAVDAVGASVTRQLCAQSVKPGGTVVFSGLHEADSILPINDLIRNEVVCKGAFAYSSSNFATALRWLEQDKIGLKEGVVIDSLEEGSAWFERLLGNAGHVSKVLLKPSPSI